MTHLVAGPADVDTKTANAFDFRFGKSVNDMSVLFVLLHSNYGKLSCPAYPESIRTSEGGFFAGDEGDISGGAG